MIVLMGCRLTDGRDGTPIPATEGFAVEACNSICNTLSPPHKGYMATESICWCTVLPPITSLELSSDKVLDSCRKLCYEQGWKDNSSIPLTPHFRLNNQTCQCQDKYDHWCSAPNFTYCELDPSN